MRLKSLKLAGFKSFANPTTFTFKHDITAIVGPNGCGKSNVIDAIRWVLGETSAKQLRGGAMSDVIFAGVEGKAGKSLASVELTFEHTQDESTGIRHALNLYHELTLRRQVTKDGKSDYFINGQRVRRRDVIDVFLGTGLGSRSYAVIEQGMIGRIVESSPMELRAFIEEAAGVSRYQARRAETQKQLDETKDNLARLTDLQLELKKQQKTLIAQAKSAKRYEILHREMADIQKDMLLKRIFEAWQTVETKKGEQKEYTKQIEHLTQNITKTKHELDKQSEQMAQAIWLKDDAKDKYHNARMAEQTAEHNFYKINQEISQAEEKIKHLATTQSQAETDMSCAHDELTKIALSLAKIAPNLTAAQDELAIYQDKLSAHQSLWQNVRTDMERLNATHRQLDNQQQLVQAEQNRLNITKQKWQKRHDELTLERQALDNIGTDDNELMDLKAQIKKWQHTINQIQLTDDKKTLDELNAKIGTLKAEIAILEKRHASLMGEHDTLHKLIYPPKPTTHGTKCAPTNDKYTTLKALKDEISLNEMGRAYSAVLDKFLGFWLDAKIGDTSCIDVVRTNTAKVTSIFYPSKQTLQMDGEFIPINMLLDKPRLALFDKVYLYTGQGVPDVSDDRVVLVDTGWIVGQFGVVQADKFGAKSDFLSQKTEHLARLAVLVDELDLLNHTIYDKKHTLKQLSSQRATLRTTLDDKTAQRQTLVDKKHQAEQALIRLESAQKNHTLKVQMNAKAYAQLIDEKAEHDNERQRFITQIADGERKLADLLPQVQTAKDKFERLSKQIDEYQHLITACHDKVQALNLQKQSLMQSQSHENKLFELAKATFAQTDSDIQDAKYHHQTLSEQLPALQQSLNQAKAHTITLQHEHEERDEQVVALQLVCTKLQEYLTDLHTTLATAQAHDTSVGADVAVGQSRLMDLSEQMLSCDETFNLSSVLVDFRANTPVFTDHRVRLDKIKQELSSIGAVNLAAVAELAELENRMSPMDKQIKDITGSMDKLKDAISTIDDKTKTLFLNMLSAVNTELNALFAKVFGGGQASLSLIDDDSLSKADKWRAGLVLMAQPKGKKNSRLGVLSGGEKTLTALSLIFAIFKQHPAPFCVLDEVDAPLDDANVGRFTSLIGELSDSVQFIFISHNKLAMQTAHELKGITMPTAGISTLVTVSLEEAQKYVES